MEPLVKAIFPIAVIGVGIVLAFGRVMMFVAYTVLAERKILGWIQGRIGPNRVGPWGLFQPFADLLKFIFKEDLAPDKSTKFIFYLAPFIALTSALMPMIVYPFGPEIVGSFDFLPYGLGEGIESIPLTIVFFRLDHLGLLMRDYLSYMPLIFY